MNIACVLSYKPLGQQVDMLIFKLCSIVILYFITAYALYKYKGCLHYIDNINLLFF